jgi:DNA mismatch endonuclease (patch repair protein)
VTRLIEKRKDGHIIRFDKQTSERMAGVRHKDTKPELIVRRVLHELGHHYRVRNRDLSGSPDIANRRRGWVVFVHGCYWHRHGCKATTTPKRNREFWEAKFRRNIERDAQRIQALRDEGYQVVVVWECETKKRLDALRDRLKQELASPN